MKYYFHLRASSCKFQVPTISSTVNKVIWGGYHDLEVVAYPIKLPRWSKCKAFEFWFVDYNASSIVPRIIRLTERSWSRRPRKDPGGGNEEKRWWGLLKPSSDTLDQPRNLHRLYKIAKDNGSRQGRVWGEKQSWLDTKATHANENLRNQQVLPNIFLWFFYSSIYYW